MRSAVDSTNVSLNEKKENCYEPCSTSVSNPPDLTARTVVSHQHRVLLVPTWINWFEKVIGSLKKTNKTQSKLGKIILKHEIHCVPEVVINFLTVLTWNKDAHWVSGTAEVPGHLQALTCISDNNTNHWLHTVPWVVLCINFHNFH